MKNIVNLEFSQKAQENTYVRGSDSCRDQPEILSKKRLSHRFTYDFYKIFKNFHFRVTVLFLWHDGNVSGKRKVHILKMNQKER